MMPEMKFESESRAAKPMVTPTIPREAGNAPVLIPTASKAVTTPMIRMVYLTAVSTNE